MAIMKHLGSPVGDAYSKACGPTMTCCVIAQEARIYIQKVYSQLAYLTVGIRQVSQVCTLLAPV